MRAVAIVLLLSGVVAAGVRWGTFVAGGSDSYCYAHQAQLWASLLRVGPGQAGHLQVVEPLALTAPWPDPPRTFAPSGHLPSPTMPGAIVPICPSGLSIVMAPFLAVAGRDAIFYVVPLFGALLIGATYRLGSRYGARIGLLAALLTACSPIVLFQLMQPMSDVPAAALWTLAAASASGTKRRSPLIAGVAAGAAILMRPNLVVLGIPVGLFLLLRPERMWRERISGAMQYAAGAACGCLTVAAIQSVYYGSPFNSGYGSLSVLFSAAHIVPNAQHYLAWMTASHSAAWLIALAAPVLLPGAQTSLLVSMIVVNVLSYLPYAVFDDWSFLRFLLPAIPLVLILVVASIDALWRRAVSRSSVAVLTLATAVLAAFFLVQARDRQVFRLQQLESRYARAGRVVAARLPERAFIVTSWESGSVRFYSGRRTLVWDQLDGPWLDRAIAFAQQQGLEPYLLFERWEEPLFRERFAGSPLARLDWPPAFEIAGQVRIYRPEDRARYIRGEMTPTVYAR